MSGAPTLDRMPNKPKTTLRNFRIPDDEYQAAQAKAKEQGTNLTAVVRDLLRSWIEQPKD
jgi:hypothetical protein